ncbi:hypothetical protein GCM10027048_16820 [Hymenobacter coalescens]
MAGKGGAGLAAGLAGAGAAAEAGAPGLVMVPAAFAGAGAVLAPSTAGLGLVGTAADLAGEVADALVGVPPGRAAAPVAGLGAAGLADEGCWASAGSAKARRKQAKKIRMRQNKSGEGGRSGPKPGPQR